MLVSLLGRNNVLLLLVGDWSRLCDREICFTNKIYQSAKHTYPIISPGSCKLLPGKLQSLSYLEIFLDVIIFSSFGACQGGKFRNNGILSPFIYLLDELHLSVVAIV